MKNKLRWWCAQGADDHDVDGDGDGDGDGDDDDAEDDGDVLGDNLGGLMASISRSEFSRGQPLY